VKRLLLSMTVALMLLPASLPAQSARSATPAENALISQMDNLSFWMGALVGERGGSVMVGMLIQPPNGVDLRGGDVIQAVNGTPVASVAALSRVFDAVSAGRSVRLTVRRAGTTSVVSFAKPAAPPRATVQMQRREPASRRTQSP
jgi:S1-C subfamily serine protease